MPELLAALAIVAIGGTTGNTPASGKSTKLETCGVPWEFYDLPTRAAGVPALIKALGNKNSYVRQRAARNLRFIGPSASAAIPALAVTLRDGCGSVSRNSALALAAIGKAAVPVLTTALTDKVHWVRWRAALALGKIGPQAAPAIQALAAALNDDNSDVRYLSARALGQIGPAAKGALEALQRARSNAPKGMRKVIDRSIAQITGAK